MGRSRYKIIYSNEPHFLTFSVLHWIPVFTRPQTAAILLNSLQYLIDDGLKVYAYVILENHMHMVAESQRLDKDISSFKSYTARKVIDFLRSANVKLILDQLAFYKKAHKDDRPFQFWQEGSHPQLISSENILRQKVDYIHQNPVKRGYVEFPEYWRYSSAVNYLGEKGLIDVYTDW